MATQTAGNVLVAVKRETVTGTAPATVTGAVRVRLIDSPGLELQRGQIRSAERRADGVRGMGRIGSKSVAGSLNTECTVGGAQDLFFEAVMRSTWTAAATIGFATMTTVAMGSNTLVAAAGDWVGAQNIRVGDVFYVSGTNTAANDNINQMVTAVTSLTITFSPGGFTTGAAAASGTITKRKKVVSAASPTRYTHSVEQYDADVDLSELFLGCRVVGLRLSARPNAPITMTWQLQGLDRTALATGTSPYFDSPTLTTGVMLVADDSTIRYNGATVTTYTGLDLDFAIDATTQPVIGSLVSADIYDGITSVTGTITGTRQDFSNLTLFDAETEFELSMLAKGTGTAPVDVLGLFLPKVKITGLSAPVGGGEASGPKIETLQLEIAPKAAATGYDGTVANISSSGA